MSKYKIVDSKPSELGGVVEVLTLGFCSNWKDYTVENEETGERYTSSAYSERQLGKNISKGLIHKLDE